MSSPSTQQQTLSPDQLTELHTLTTNVERAMTPVIREREEQQEDETKAHLLQSIASSKNV